MERVKGIEPSSKAWEAFILPLNYTRKCKAPKPLKDLKYQGFSCPLDFKDPKT